MSPHTMIAYQLAYFYSSQLIKKGIPDFFVLYSIGKILERHTLLRSCAKVQESFEKYQFYETIFFSRHTLKHVIA